MAMNINVNVSSSGLRAGSRTYKIPDIKTQKVDLTQKMHHYEGYRVPDGTDLSKLSKAHIVMNSKGEKYVVSEKTAQQMQSDLNKYSLEQFAPVEELNAQSSKEAAEKTASDMSKIYQVIARMCRGDSVPFSDEQRLMKFDPRLYQMAKNAQTMEKNLRKKTKKYGSLWDEKEEKEWRDLQNGLNEISDQALSVASNNTKVFAGAQADSIENLGDLPEDFSQSSLSADGHINLTV